MQVSKKTSSIARLFASPDIHYHNSLNTEMQKQKKPKYRNFKVVDSVVFGIHCNTFFQHTLSFPKFQ